MVDLSGLQKGDILVLRDGKRIKADFIGYRADSYYQIAVGPYSWTVDGKFSHMFEEYPLDVVEVVRGGDNG